MEPSVAGAKCCLNNCESTVPEEVVKYFSESFQKLRSADLELDFIADHVTETTARADAKRRYSREYYVASFKVCEQFFRSTLNISKRTIASALEKSRNEDCLPAANDHVAIAEDVAIKEREGDAAMQQKKYVVAVAKYSEAIGADSKIPRLLLKRAECCFILSELDLAERDAVFAIKMDVNISAAYSVLKKIYELQGFETIREQVKLCDVIIASNAEISQKLAASRVKNELIPVLLSKSAGIEDTPLIDSNPVRNDDVPTTSRESTRYSLPPHKITGPSLDLNIEVSKQKVQRFILEGKVAEADTLIGVLNFSSDSHNALGDALIALKICDEEVKKAITEKNYEVCLKHLEKIIKIAKHSVIHKKIQVRCLLKLTRLDESAKILTVLLEENPNDAELLFLWAVIKYKSGHIQKTLNLLEKSMALRSTPESRNMYEKVKKLEKLYGEGN